MAVRAWSFALLLIVSAVTCQEPNTQSSNSAQASNELTAQTLEELGEPQELPEMCPMVKDDDVNTPYFEDPYDCNCYYVCDKWRRPMRMCCHENLWWHPISQTCFYKQQFPRFRQEQCSRRKERALQAIESGTYSYFPRWLQEKLTSHKAELDAIRSLGSREDEGNSAEPSPNAIPRGRTSPTSPPNLPPPQTTAPPVSYSTPGPSNLEEMFGASMEQEEDLGNQYRATGFRQPQAPAPGIQIADQPVENPALYTQEEGDEDDDPKDLPDPKDDARSGAKRGFSNGIQGDKYFGIYDGPGPALSIRPTGKDQSRQITIRVDFEDDDEENDGVQQQPIYTQVFQAQAGDQPTQWVNTNPQASRVQSAYKMGPPANQPATPQSKPSKPFDFRRNGQPLTLVKTQLDTAQPEQNPQNPPQQPQRRRNFGIRRLRLAEKYQPRKPSPLPVSQGNNAPSQPTAEQMNEYLNAYRQLTPQRPATQSQPPAQPQRIHMQPQRSPAQPQHQPQTPPTNPQIAQPQRPQMQPQSPPTQPQSPPMQPQRPPTQPQPQPVPQPQRPPVQPPQVQTQPQRPPAKYPTQQPPMPAYRPAPAPQEMPQQPPTPMQPQRLPSPPQPPLAPQSLQLPYSVLQQQQQQQQQYQQHQQQQQHNQQQIPHNHPLPNSPTAAIQDSPQATLRTQVPDMSVPTAKGNAAYGMVSQGPPSDGQASPTSWPVDVSMDDVKSLEQSYASYYVNKAFDVERAGEAGEDIAGAETDDLLLEQKFTNTQENTVEDGEALSLDRYYANLPDEYIYGHCTVQPNPAHQELQDFIWGSIDLRQSLKGGATELRINMTGFNKDDKVTQHGFHIHEYGDLSTGCESAGGHYDPFGVVHGGPEDAPRFRHFGDLGNVKENGEGEVVEVVNDLLVSLLGPFSVLGRAVVIHEKEDDLGRAQNEQSLLTGNAGSRLACCTIGLSDGSRWTDGWDRQWDQYQTHTATAADDTTDTNNQL